VKSRHAEPPEARREVSRDWIRDETEARRLRDRLALLAAAQGNGRRVGIEPFQGGYSIIITAPSKNSTGENHDVH
jgi:hypothetical protein